MNFLLKLSNLSMRKNILKYFNPWYLYSTKYLTLLNEQANLPLFVQIKPIRLQYLSDHGQE